MDEVYEAHVVLHAGMHFQGVTQHSDDFVIHMDSDADFGGMDRGARPLDVMLVSLAGCAGMDVVSILRKKQQKITGLDIRVRSERATEYPKVFTHIWMHFIVTGDAVLPAAVERSIELSVTKYCPAAALIKQAGVPIDTSYVIISAPA
jgi:putative redox protein